MTDNDKNENRILYAEIHRLNLARNEMITEMQIIKEINRYLANGNRCLARKIRELT